MIFSIEHHKNHKRGFEMLEVLKRLCVGVVAMASVTGMAMADQLDDVRSRGTLTVGIKNDYMPFGFLDREGHLKGLEIDLAEAVAKSILGPEGKIEFVPVVASNRIELLKAGRIDLVLATLGESPERARVVDFTDAYYSMAGIVLLASKDTTVKTWDDTKGRKLCGVQGNMFNRILSEKYGAQLALFSGTSELFNAFKDGRCEGIAFDGPILQQKLNDPDWAGKYKIALETFRYIPIVGGVRKGEPAFLEAVNKAIRSAAADDVMINAEKNYSMGTSDYVAKRAADAKASGL